MTTCSRLKMAAPVLGLAFFLSLGHGSAQAQARDAGLGRAQPTPIWTIQYEPCRNGRVHWGRPVDCERMYDRWQPRRPALPRDYEPCRDGRVQWGRPVSCGEILDRLYGRDWWDDRYPEY